MFETIKKHPGAITGAFIFHLLMGLLFVVGFNFTDKSIVEEGAVPVTLIPLASKKISPVIAEQLKQHDADFEALKIQKQALENQQQIINKASHLDAETEKQVEPVVVPLVNKKKLLEEAKRAKQSKQADKKALAEKKAKAKAKSETKRKARASANKEAKRKARKEAKRKAKQKAKQKAKEKAKKKAREKAKSKASKLAKDKRKKEAKAAKAKEESAEKEKRKKAEAKKKAIAEAKTKAKIEATRKIKEKAKKESIARAAKDKTEKVAKEKAAKQAEKERQQGMANLASAAKTKRDAEKKAQRAKEAKRKSEQAVKQAAEAKAKAQARKIALGNWGSKVRRHVSPRWQTPPGSSGMKATVKIKVSRSGYIRSLKVVSCKGSSSFCSSVKTAFRNAEPLPSPSRNDLFDENLNITLKR